MTQITFLVNIDDAIQVARDARSAGFKLMRMNKGSWWVGDSDMLSGKLPLFKILIDSRRMIPRGYILRHIAQNPLNIFRRPEIEFGSSTWRPFVTNLNFRIDTRNIQV